MLQQCEVISVTLSVLGKKLIAVKTRQEINLYNQHSTLLVLIFRPIDFLGRFLLESCLILAPRIYLKLRLINKLL